MLHTSVNIKKKKILTGRLVANSWKRQGTRERCERRGQMTTLGTESAQKRDAGETRKHRSPLPQETARHWVAGNGSDEVGRTLVRAEEMRFGSANENTRDLNIQSSYVLLLSTEQRRTILTNYVGKSHPEMRRPGFNFQQGQNNITNPPTIRSRWLYIRLREGGPKMVELTAHSSIHVNGVVLNETI
jgi:hypothetical protein